MDDYNMNVLSEAKNEYSSRLVTILTPLVTEGIRSIFNEAYTLCKDNDEDEKYLMTFQNFLSRVPKWNSTIIDEEKNRVLNSSGCSYLEDLIICVHITQLKILTSIRVSQKQKKIDIDIPEINTFIHKCYIQFARKLYSNVYLFEKNLLPLNFQKNNREIEIICQECILQVVRDSMPIEKILRAYIDETVDEEVIEEMIEKTVEENVAKQMEDKVVVKTAENLVIEKESIDMNTIKMPELIKKKPEELEDVNTSGEKTQPNINLIITTPVKEPTQDLVKEPIKDPIKPHLSFNDSDSVLDMGTNQSNEISAPKTIERLEKISKDQNEKRKLEEEEEDDETLKIMDNVSIKLDTLDIHNLDTSIKLEPDLLLDDIEVLT